MLDGLEFNDGATGRQMLCKELEGNLWLLYKHPHGQWVTYRKANDDDVSKLTPLALLKDCLSLLPAEAQP